VEVPRSTDVAAAAIQRPCDSRASPLTTGKTEAVIPHGLAMRQDEEHDGQEQMSQILGDIPHDREADLLKRLAEEERRLQEAERKIEELRQEEVVAEDAVKAASELLLEKKAALAQTAFKFRVAKRNLAEERQAQQAVCDKFKKFASDSDVLTHARTHFFEPLKTGTLPLAHSVKKVDMLMRSIGGRLELDDALSAALPKALVAPISERNSFTSMVVHEFEQTLVAGIEDLRMQCKAGDSLIEARAAAMCTAQQALALVDGNQMEAAQVFTEANDAHNARREAWNEKKEALRNTRLLLRECESSLAELQVEVGKSQGELWRAIMSPLKSPSVD